MEAQLDSTDHTFERTPTLERTSEETTTESAAQPSSDVDTETDTNIGIQTIDIDPHALENLSIDYIKGSESEHRIPTISFVGKPAENWADAMETTSVLGAKASAPQGLQVCHEDCTHIKNELHQILNFFQSKPHGRETRGQSNVTPDVILSQHLRDPRKNRLSQYLHVLDREYVSIRDTRRTVCLLGTPRASECIQAFQDLSTELRAIATRIDVVMTFLQK